MTYAIVGIGRSGEAARRLLLRRGISPNEIAIFDDKAAAADYSDPETMFRDHNPDVLVVSPGVPLAKQWIQDARARGVRITSEISLAVEDLADEKLIGVTGSVGKSTTVSLLGEGAKVIDRHAFVGGNLGVPLGEYVADVLEGRVPRAKWVVIELSSFQLENCEGLRLDFAAITSLTPNHLERYKDLTHYYQTKWALSSISRTPVFINSRGGDVLAFSRTQPEHIVPVDREDRSLSEFHLENAALLGKHNQDDLALAATVALAAEWGPASIEAMKRFPGLPHRLQSLPPINGVRFVNDSKATALDSVITAVDAALETLPPSGRLHLLLGGRDKNLPWDVLKPLSAMTRLAPVFFGECASLAHEKSALQGPTFPTLREAIDGALRTSRTGDIVLLSPGGSSLDEFKNFEARGEYFARRIQERAGLITSHGDPSIQNGR